LALAIALLFSGDSGFAVVNAEDTRLITDATVISYSGLSFYGGPSPSQLQNYLTRDVNDYCVGDRWQSDYPSGDGEPGIITTDLQEIYPIEQIKLWHYFCDGRQYGGVKVEVSTTGEFNGEETVVYYNEGLGPAETIGGNTIDVNVLGRYVRHTVNHTLVSGNINQWTHFAGIRVWYSTAPSASPSGSPSSVPSLLPSASPSDSPSSVPSLVPSVVPSNAPSGSPSSMPSYTSKPSSKPSLACPEDGADLFFAKNNNGKDRTRDCNWLKNKPSKPDSSKPEGRQIKRFCRQTESGEGYPPAGKVCVETCAAAESGRKIMVNGKKKSCNWLSKRNPTRKEHLCTNMNMNNICYITCGGCPN